MSAARFTVFEELDPPVVLDRKTCLFWERSPSTAEMDWATAHAHCRGSRAGPLAGRLPTVDELRSLLDPSVRNGVDPALAAGHPFDTVKAYRYWSDTGHEQEDQALTIDFRQAEADAVPKSNRALVWRVFE